MEQFSWFDIISVSLILILAIKGIINGFIKEVFGLMGIIGGIYIASRYAQFAGEWIDTNIFLFENKGSLFLIGFIALLLTIWILSIFLGYIFAKLLSMSGLGILDKLAGFIVGGAKVFLIFAILLAIISNIDFIQKNLDKYLHNSFMYPIFIQTGEYIVKKNKSTISSFRKNGSDAPQPSLQKTNRKSSVNITSSDKNLTSEVAHEY